MQDVTLETLLDHIYCATDEELNPIITAVTERFTEVWPQWGLLTLTVKGHGRKSHIEALLKVSIC